MDNKIKYRNTQIDPREAWTTGFGPMPVMPHVPPEPKAKAEPRAPRQWKQLPEFVNPGTPPSDDLPVGDERSSTLTDIRQERQATDARINKEKNTFARALGGAAQQTIAGSIMNWLSDQHEAEQGRQDEEKFGPPAPFKPDPKDLDDKTLDQQKWLLESRNERQFRDRLGQLQAFELDTSALYNKGIVSGIALGMLSGIPENMLLSMAGGAGATSVVKNLASAAKLAQNAKKIEIAGEIAAGAIGTSFQANIDPNVGISDVAMGIATDWATSRLPLHIKDAISDRRAGSIERSIEDIPEEHAHAEGVTDNSTPNAETKEHHTTTDKEEPDSLETPQQQADRVKRFADSVQVNKDNLSAANDLDPHPQPSVANPQLRIDQETGEILDPVPEIKSNAQREKDAEASKQVQKIKDSAEDAKLSTKKKYDDPDPSPDEFLNEDPDFIPDPDLGIHDNIVDEFDENVHADEPLEVEPRETHRPIGTQPPAKKGIETDHDRISRLEEKDEEVARAIREDSVNDKLGRKLGDGEDDFVEQFRQLRETKGIAKAKGGNIFIQPGIPSSTITHARNLIDTFLPGTKAIIRRSSGNEGSIRILGRNHAVIDAPITGKPTDHVVLGHEIGHMVVTRWLKDTRLNSGLRKDMERLINEIQAKSFEPGKAQEAAAARSGSANGRISVKPDDTRSLVDILKGVYREQGADSAKNAAYLVSRQEIGADLFQKYLERVAERGKDNPVSIPRKLVHALNRLYNKLLALIKKTGTPLDDRAEAFFDAIANVNATHAEPRGKAKESGDGAVVHNYKVHPATTQPYGEDLLPEHDNRSKGVKAAVKSILAKARSEDPGRVEQLPLQERIINSSNPEAISNSLISASAIMANSKNVIVRWMGAKLAESPSGLGINRQKTAAIRKHVLRNGLIGRSMHDLESAASEWAKSKGYSLGRRLIDPRIRDMFNKELTDAMIEFRHGQAPSDPALLKGVMAWHDLAQRKLDMDRKYRKVGATQKLDIKPEGYMPRKLDGAKVSALTADQRFRFQKAIEAHFLKLGWSPEISEKTSRTYLDYAAKQRLGITASKSIDMTDPDNVEDIVKILIGQGMTEAQARSLAGGFAGKLDSHLKHRINIDESIDLGGVRIIDLMVHDHVALMRDLANETSGWAAMSEVGIHSQGELDIMREAIAAGAGENAVSAAEMKAFDQVVAEITGTPFGTAGRSKVLAAVQSLTSVIRLGGLVFNNAPEILNLAGAAGVGTAIKFFPQIRTMLREIKGIVNGGSSQNGLLASMERLYGAHFGTDGYLLASPWDSPGFKLNSGAQYEEGIFIRSLNAIGHAQGVLTGVRALTHAQQRYTAQEMTRLALEYAQGFRGGEKAKKYLADIGLSESFINRVKGDLASATSWNGDRAIGFNIDRLKPEDAETFAQAIWRGSKQIIQGEFAGEHGAWVHSDVGRAMGQFKAFGILSMEKQLLRQWNILGPIEFSMFFLGTASACLPIHMMRVMWNSLGKEEEERRKYLDNALSTTALATAVMTYMSTSGLLADIAQGVTSIFSSNSYNDELVGGQIAPSIGLVNDLWEVASFNKNVLRVIPGLNAAPLVPIMNYLRHESSDFVAEIRGKEKRKHHKASE